MDAYFYVSLVVQRCFAERFNIELQQVKFDKNLGKSPPSGYGFNPNSLLAFVQFEIKNEILKNNPSIVIKIEIEQAKKLVKGTTIPLIAYIAQQL
jgi:hypothetical protein